MHSGETAGVGLRVIIYIEGDDYPYAKNWDLSQTKNGDDAVPLEKNFNEAKLQPVEQPF